MIWIECLGHRKKRSINVSGDNFLLISVFAAAAAADLPGSLVSALIALFVITLGTEIFCFLRLLSLRARPLRPEQGPAILAIVAREASIMGIKKFAQHPQIEYIPNATAATAFILGGFSPKLVVTGRMIVAAVTAPEATELIVRHELSHLANRDHRMWLFLGSIPIGIILFPLLLQSGDSFQSLLPQAFSGFVSTCLGIWVMFILFRRREYLADALTVNQSRDCNSYLQLLRGGPTHRKSWFHPSRADRISALEYGSPVLRSNIVMLVILTFASIASAAYVVQGFQALHPSERGEILIRLFGLAVVFGMFVAALILELGKGFGRKIPVASSGEATLRRLPVDYPSRLASLFGVGGPDIRWTHMLAFVCATSVTWFSTSLFWVLGNVRNPPGASPLASYFSPSFFIFLSIWCVTYLIALRVSPSLGEVGTVMGIAGVLMFSPGFGIDAVGEFVAEFAAVLLLGLCVRKFQNVWVGLWIGTMADTVLISTLRRIDWSNLMSLTWSYWRSLSFSGMRGVVLAAIFASIYVLVVKFTARVANEKVEASSEHAA